MKDSLDEINRKAKILINKINISIDKNKQNKERTLKYTIDGFKYNKATVSSIKQYYDATNEYTVTINTLNPFLYELIINWR